MWTCFNPFLKNNIFQDAQKELCRDWGRDCNTFEMGFIPTAFIIFYFAVTQSKALLSADLIKTLSGCPVVWLSWRPLFSEDPDGCRHCNLVSGNMLLTLIEVQPQGRLLPGHQLHALLLELPHCEGDVRSWYSWISAKSKLMKLTISRRICIYHNRSLRPGRSLHRRDTISCLWSFLHG